MPLSHAFVQSLPKSVSTICRRITIPGELPQLAVTIISFTVVLLAFAFDVITKEDIRLGVLYLFPVFLMSIHHGRSKKSFLLLALALFCQVFALLSFHISTTAKIVESIVKAASIVLVYLLSLEVREMHLMIMNIAIKDPLTNALSHRSFEVLLDQEIVRQNRYGGVFSLAFIDLDNFKKLNDNRGHRVGDKALVLFTEILQECTRKSDFTGRIGGDEFAILMLHTGGVDCGTICRNLSDTIQSRMLSAGFNITASIGYLSFDRPPESAVDALDRVDKVMYTVKANKKGSVAGTADQSANSEPPQLIHTVRQQLS